jgi:hypothetical protein
MATRTSLVDTERCVNDSSKSITDDDEESSS